VAAELADAFPLSRLRSDDLAVGLRPLRAEDAPALFKVMGQDPEMTWTRRRWTQANVDYLLSLRIQHYDAEGFGVYGVVDPADETIIGMAGLQFWDDTSEEVEVIAYVERRRWNGGIAKGVLRWMVDRTWRKCPSVTNIKAATRHDNKAAQALASSLGMQKTGEGDHYGAYSILWDLSRPEAV
jgi:RimJ/RimL family protein N-acetyltransferase